MAVAVEPVLTEEKLRSLLAEGHEQSALDYKRGLDLDQRRDVVELAKDVAAMQSEVAGGYIVVGADDQGNVVPNLTATQATLFDEARLRGKLQRYIAEPFDVRSTVHQVNGRNVALVYVAPSPEGWCIFRQDGEYEDPPGSRRTVFRVGEVFVRRGTASQRWDDTDRKRLIEQVMARRKDAWRTELRHEMAATMNVGLSAQRLEQMPASALHWQLDEAGFDELVTELMRRGDDIPLRRLLLRAPADAQGLISNLDELATLLDRVASVAGLGLTYERQQWFDQAAAALVRIYELGFGEYGARRSDADTARLWLYVMTRVYGLGGLAVRMRNWEAVRQLASRRPRGEGFQYYVSWLRHALTMAARAQILDDERQAGLIAHAHNVVREVAALHPDTDAHSEDVLNSLCQFDALGALVILSKSDNRRAYYPNFSRYGSRRTEPAFVTVIRDQAPRQAIYPGDDDALATAIRHIDEDAQHEGFSYDGWGGFGDPTVRRFLEEHP
jgi:Putative DNA-binding domain